MKSVSKSASKKSRVRKRSVEPDIKRVNLALQGGGSHGAYTWGVLDALLEDGRFEFDALTGASAGAMNAVVLADGWLDGKSARRDPRETARQALRDFWNAIGDQPASFALNPGFGPGMSQQLAQNPLMQWFDLVSRLYSPYQLNPFNFNPLRNVLNSLIDFDRLRRDATFKLFICATNVRTGHPRIFREHEMQLDMLLASACLPFAFQAVRVADDYYWDGGYMGNPALWPVFYASKVQDLVLVQINPLRRDDVPDTAQEIIDRASEISFNASLLHEMRAIEFVQRLLNEKRLDPQHYQRLYLHVISAEETMRNYGASSKYNTSPAFLKTLFELGRATAHEWLELKFDYVGHAPSVRIAEMFL